MTHSIEVIEKNLSKLQKLNYNQFFWWRRWTRLGKSLHKYSPLIDKIENGDYNDSPYRWQIYYCDWEIEQKRLATDDMNEWAHDTTIDRNRRRRLREDHEKYEKENLTQLQRDFLSTFKMTREDYENDLLEFDGTLKAFYIQCISKYHKFNNVTKPRRGRPPKIQVDSVDSPF
tara:strand:- start:2190 stop:2708 length:519 start_codon:yes stop_codon:yes gene_type:complete